MGVFSAHHIHIAEHYRYIVKYDLMMRTKTTQLPAVFTNVTDIRSSVDTGKLSAYMNTIDLDILLHFSRFPFA